MMKNKKNRLVIFGTGNPYLNTQVIQINPGPGLVIKQKGDKMRKIAMIVGLISVLATSANAGYWSSSPNAFGGYNYQYNYSTNDILNQYGLGLGYGFN